MSIHNLNFKNTNMKDVEFILVNTLRTFKYIFSAKPKYTGNQTETVHAYVGQSVLLPCTSSGYPPPTTHFTPSYDPKGKNRYAMLNAGMQIQSVEITDG